MLHIVVEDSCCNMNILNYLGVTFNFDDGTYKLCKKPNDEMKYTHVHSDHPSPVIKQIPKSIATRLFSLSSSKEISTKPHHITDKALQVANIKKN